MDSGERKTEEMTASDMTEHAEHCLKNIAVLRHCLGELILPWSF